MAHVKNNYCRFIIENRMEIFSFNKKLWQNKCESFYSKYMGKFRLGINFDQIIFAPKTFCEETRDIGHRNSILLCHKAEWVQKYKARNTLLKSCHTLQCTQNLLPIKRHLIDKFKFLVYFYAFV